MPKALIAIFFGIMLAFSVTACGGSESEECTACKEDCELIGELGGEQSDVDACVAACEAHEVCN